MIFPYGLLFILGSSSIVITLAANLPAPKYANDDLSTVLFGEDKSSDGGGGGISGAVTHAFKSNMLNYMQDVVDDINEIPSISDPQDAEKVARDKNNRNSRTHGGGTTSSSSSSGGGFKKKAMCTACTFLIHSMRWANKIGVPSSLLMGIVREACEKFSGKTDRVCIGMISTFKDDIPMLLDKSQYSANAICATFFSVCPAHASAAKLNWDIIVPAKINRGGGAQQLTAGGVGAGKAEQFIFAPVVIAASAPTSPIRVLHLSDIHLDLLYRVGSGGICRDPLCCRDDAQDESVPKAGYWGYSGFCDTPIQFLDAMLEHVARTQHIDFVLWTGDSVPHDVWSQSRPYQLNVTAQLNAAIKKHFPHTLVFPTLGNHDSYPVNSFPLPSTTGRESVSWLYQFTANEWVGWGPDASQRENILHGGYYAQRPINRPGLKIISLNTNYCSKLNWWLLLNADDPAGQMSWLVKELQDSESKNEAVYIISHISPTGDKCIKPWRDNYYRIVARFKDTIRGSFFGHSHYDEYGVTYDPQNLTQPTSIAFITPSITSYRHINPGYRIYLVSPSTAQTPPPYTILDAETWIVNLTDANARSAARPNGIGHGVEDLQWGLEYSARKLYNMPDLSAQSWSDLTTRMKNDDALFKTYYDNYYKQQASWTSKVCEGACKARLICTTQANACPDADGLLLW